MPGGLRIFAPGILKFPCQRKVKSMYKKCKTIQSARRQQYIIETLVSLMQEHTFEEITVSSLCQQANIPRKSFYRYFDTKKDLLQATLDSIQDSYHRYTAPRRPQNATIEEDLTLFFSFWKEHSSVLSAIRFSRMSNIFVENRVKDAFRERKGDRLTACFAVTGLYGVLLEWAYGGFPGTPGEMARHTLRLFTMPLSQTLFQSDSSDNLPPKE